MYVTITGNTVELTFSMAQVAILAHIESFIYELPCFPVVQMQLVSARLSSVSSHGQLSVQFHGHLFIEGVSLPLIIMPAVSFDIKVRYQVSCHGALYMANDWHSHYLPTSSSSVQAASCLGF